MNLLAKYFFRGLLILIPVVVTAYVVYAVYRALNEAVFAPLADLVHWDVPAGVPTLLAIVVTLCVIVLIGILASNLLGTKLLSMMENVIKKLPLIKLLYNSVKDLLGAFVGDKKSFDQPVVASLTEDGVAKVVGFVTRDSLEFLGIADHVAVYLPQSYNFAGNLVLFPKDRVKALQARSSDVMTFLVSGGVSGREDSAR